MLLFEIIKEISYFFSKDRISPIVPFIYWELHFIKDMKKPCKKQFSKSFEIRPKAYVIDCSKVKIGSVVIIRPAYMVLHGESASLFIFIKDKVMLGAGVHFYISNNDFDRLDILFIDQGYYLKEALTIEKEIRIGANEVLLPGVTIGDNIDIGAWSFVYESTPSNLFDAVDHSRILKTLA